MPVPNYQCSEKPHLLPVFWLILILVCSDSDYTEPDNVKGNYEWPVTLPPKLLRDGFQIQPSEVIIAVSDVTVRTDLQSPSPPQTSQPTPITTTEYTTFTYFATRKVGEKTVTETDIVVSSNIVTTTPSVEPTPSLPPWKLDQVGKTACRHLTSRTGVSSSVDHDH